MNRFFKLLLLTSTLLPVASVIAQTAGGPEQQLDEPITKAQAMTLAIAIENYWTPERMADARPAPIPEVILDELTLASPALEEAAHENEREPVLPGYAPGWKPGQGEQPPTDLEYVVAVDGTLQSTMTEDYLAQPKHGSRPSNPRLGPYGPFQRWTEFDPITDYPKSTHGKLFFTIDGDNYVCSATVIQRNTLITAGHCNSDGSGTLATNRLFCPSYRNGQNPTLGCWAVIGSKTSSRWHNNGDPDYDYACLITGATGTRVANRIGNVTGWLGRAWNWGSTQPVRTFGYPAAAPFNGNRLVTTASTEWYSHHFKIGGQSSKVIGSDLTGGASGGSWVLGWNREGQEFADTDGQAATDPGANMVNGVNSHKRCRTSCRNPPTNSEGVFWQEMTSPQFRKTSAGDESEDIIAVCLNNGGA